MISIRPYPITEATLLETNVREHLNAGIWAAGGSMVTARRALGGAGTQTAGLGFGGDTGSISAVTQEYDGITWSAGGPLLHPSVPGWVMVPIAPHTLSNRPIVLSNSTEIVITLVAGRDASANFDMQSLASLLRGDRIVVTRSQHHVRFLHPKGWTYFDNLRQKLHWNEGAV